MRKRFAVTAAVAAFAVIVAAVALVAGRGGGDQLVRLPALAAGTGQADAAAEPAARSMLAPAVKVEYTVKGDLPDLPSTAAAYRLPSDTTPDAVAKVAAALGLDGPVRADADGWSVTAGDRALRVQRAPGVPWYLGPACPDATVSSDGKAGVAAGCAAGSGGVATGGGTASDLPATVVPSCPADTPKCTVAPTVTAVTAVPAPEPGTKPPAPPVPPDGPVTVAPVPPELQRPERPAGLPSQDEATKLARELFARLGAGDAGLDVVDGWSVWSAHVDGVVGGARVPTFGSSLSIGPAGRVEYATGWLAAPERIGDYPLVGVQGGLDRLRQGGWWPGLMAADGRSAGAGWAPYPANVAPPETAVGVAPPAVAQVDPLVTIEPPTGPLPPAPVTVVVTGARLTLVPAGDALVPAYLFDLEGGGQAGPVPAVTDRWLDHGGSSKD